MALFQRKSLETKASTNTWGSEWRLFNGIPGDDNDGLDPGRAGQEKAYTAEAWVYRCLDLKLGAAASVPLHVVGPQKGKDEMVAIENHPALEMLYTANPLGYVVGSDLLKFSLGSLELHGETYWTYGTSGNVPKEIYWRPVGIMEPIPDEKTFIRGFKMQTGQAKTVELPPSEVAYFRYPSLTNPLRGLGKIEAMRPYIDLDIFALQTNLALHRNGAIPPWVLTTDQAVNDTQQKTLREMLAQWLGGPTKRGRPMVLGSGMKAQMLQTSAKDGEWLQSQKMVQEVICSILGVPLQLAGSQEKSTFNNFIEARTSFWQDTMILWLDWWAEQLTAQFLRRVEKDVRLRFQFDYKAIEGLGDDVAQIWERFMKFMERIDTQVARRIVTPDQARVLLASAAEQLGLDAAAYEGLVPMGATFTESYTHIPIEQLSAQTVIDIMAARGNSPQLEEDVPGAPHAAENATKPNPNAPKPPTDNSAAPAGKPVAPRKEYKAGLADRSREVRLTPVQRKLANRLKKFFQKLQTEALRRLRGAKADVGNIEIKADAADLYDADAVRAELEALVTEGIISASEAAYIAANEDFSVGVSWDATNPWLAEYMGMRLPLIHGIEDTMRQALQDQLLEGATAGETIDDLAKRVAAVFRDQIDNNATTIARTETIQAYGAASIQSYRDGGLEHAEMYDGDNDDSANCADVNGQIVTLDEAAALMADEHPNGTRGVSPVVDSAVLLEAASDPTVLMWKAVQALESMAEKNQATKEAIHAEEAVKSDQFDQLITLLTTIVTKEQVAPVIQFSPTIDATSKFEKGALVVQMPEEKPKADIIVKHPDGRETRVKRS